MKNREIGEKIGDLKGQENLGKRVPKRKNQPTVQILPKS